jgi:molybdenum cofactor synthesis domain-containing protein
MNRTAAVITMSDKGSRGERVDTAGPAVQEILRENGYDIVHTRLIPDDYDTIRQELLDCCDNLQVNLVVTTGGTGFSPRDVTPEATASVVERPTPGIAEAMRYESLKITPMAMLSRATAGIRGTTLIVNLPGSEKAARENLQAVVRPLVHGLDVLLGQSGDCAQLHHHHHHKEEV